MEKIPPFLYKQNMFKAYSAYIRRGGGVHFCNFFLETLHLLKQNLKKIAQNMTASPATSSVRDLQAHKLNFSQDGGKIRCYVLSQRFVPSGKLPLGKLSLQKSPLPTPG